MYNFIMFKLYVFNHYYDDKIRHFMSDDKIKYITSKQEIKENNYKIVYCVYDEKITENVLFKNNVQTLDIMNNKSKYAHFMKMNYPNHFSKIYFYEYDDVKYLNDNVDTLMIKKNNYGSSGCGVEIVEHLNFNQCVITEYIPHDVYFSSHHIVLNGKIISKIFFKAFNNEKNFIQKGAIKNYEILKNIENEDIFEKIFERLNYSGFINCDFTIIQNTVIFFEINARIGGSLLLNYEIMNSMMYELYDNLENKYW